MADVLRAVVADPWVMMKLLANGAALPSGTVTFLLTDIEGSSRIWEADVDAARAALTRHHEILSQAITSCDGARPIEQGEGDSAVGVFARATDAVRAAVCAQQALAEEPWPTGEPLRVRMALNSGEADVSADGTYAGAVLNRCGRLRALAHGGQVLISEATRDLAVDQLEADTDVELVDLGAHRLRDLSRPEHVWQLAGPGLETEFPQLRSLDASPNNLPLQLSTFIGREGDIDRALALLAETRLLTLTGSGGCGKTRLAQRVAGEASARFADGVWWVELAPVVDAAVVPSTIADAVGLRVPVDRETTATLLAHLRHQKVLLVLDNCEHLVSDVAGLADRMLRACPELTILTTSREPLGVEGEVTWRVPSLPAPHGATEPDAVRQYDAVRLFIDRAVQARPNFAVTNENAPAVAQICHRLDGIPLAIELAAARTRLLPPERIAAELDDRFRLLSGGSRTALPRQQTLLASVDWSHNLLDPEERALLRRLGVFTGGFTIDAAEAVAAIPPLDGYAVFDLLARLVDKSLVQVEHGVSTEDVRYRLLETIRQYAVDRLEEAGETATVRARQLDWVLTLVEALEPAVTNAHGAALTRLELELPNIRVALDWAVTAPDCDRALRLVSSLAFFWSHRGHFAEAAAWAPRGIALSPAEGHPLLARARWGSAYVRFYGGDFSGAYAQATQALEEARTVGDRWCEARCLHTLGTTWLLSDANQSRALVVDAYQTSLETGDRWCEADSLQMLAYSHLVQGHPDAAEEYLERARPVTDELDNDFHRAWYFTGVGHVAAMRGQFDVARRAFERGVETARRVGDPTTELWGSAIWTYHELVSGRPEEAVAVASSLTEQRREWGAFGDALIPGTVAMSQFTTDPEGAFRMLTGLGELIIAAGDLLDGTLFLTAGALAAIEAGELQAAERALDTALGAFSGTSTFLARAQTARASVARATGDATKADLLAHDALAFGVEHSNCIDAAEALEVLGGLALDAGSVAESVRLLAAGEAFRSQIGQRRLPSGQAQFEADVAAAAAALGDEHDAVWAAGSALSWQEAAAYARRARGERKRPTFGWDSLTPTELEVVRLAAEGLTNPQIGERLFIGRGTVKTHLAHVFAKLGVANRAELAAQASLRLSSTT